MVTSDVLAPEPLTVPSAGTLTIERAGDGIEWNRYVDAHAAASAYHRWEWRSVFEGPFRQRCEYLVALRRGSVAGVLPLVHFRSWLFGRFTVSLPYVNYGGVLADDGDSARALVDAASGAATQSGSRHLELRHHAQQFPELPAKRHKVAMRLALADHQEAMWQRLDRKVRNQVRKAEKSGLVAATGGAELVPEFYAVFARNMRDLGTPVYGREVFEAVLAAIGDRARVHVVRIGDLPVAAALSIEYRDTIEVPWASSLREHRALSPNNLLYWHVIRHAIGARLAMFDFGRSTPNEGTFHFKRQWGAEPEPLVWEYRVKDGHTVPDHSPRNPRFSIAIAAWQRLPVRLTTWIGPAIVRAIP